MERNNFACPLLTCFVIQEDNADALYSVEFIYNSASINLLTSLFYVYLIED
jgi:hypothetical protein